MKKQFKNVTEVIVSGIPPGQIRSIEIDADGLALDMLTRQAIKKGWLKEEKELKRKQEKGEVNGSGQ